MSARAKMVWSGLVGGAILLGAQRTGLAATTEASPPGIPDTPAAAADEDNANPYSVIIDRNVFRLNPPPPPEVKDPKPPPDLPEVKLAGFMKTGDKLNVLLSVKVKSKDPKAPDSMSYLTLAEGETAQAGETGKEVVEELVKVYADQEKVDIINSGTPLTLSMKDNGYAAPPGTPAKPGGTPAIINRTIPTVAPPPVTGLPPATSLPPVYAPSMDGANPGGGTLVGGRGGAFNSPSLGSPSSPGVGGGSGLSSSFPSTPTAYSGLGSRTSFGGSTLVGGGVAPPSLPATPTTATQLSPVASMTTIPRQPNSTPPTGNDMGGGIMPPVPMAPR